eukprot:436593_1
MGDNTIQEEVYLKLDRIGAGRLQNTRFSTLEPKLIMRIFAHLAAAFDPSLAWNVTGVDQKNLAKINRALRVMDVAHFKMTKKLFLGKQKTKLLHAMQSILGKLEMKHGVAVIYSRSFINSVMKTLANAKNPGKRNAKRPPLNPRTSPRPKRSAASYSVSASMQSGQQVPRTPEKPASNTSQISSSNNSNVESAQPIPSNPECSSTNPEVNTDASHDQENQLPRENGQSKRGEELFERLKSLDPSTSLDDYFNGGEWDMGALVDDIRISEKDLQRPPNDPRNRRPLPASVPSIELGTPPRKRSPDIPTNPPVGSQQSASQRPTEQLPSFSQDVPTSSRTVVTPSRTVVTPSRTVATPSRTMVTPSHSLRPVGASSIYQTPSKPSFLRGIPEVPTTVYIQRAMSRHGDLIFDNFDLSAIGPRPDAITSPPPYTDSTTAKDFEIMVEQSRREREETDVAERKQIAEYAEIVKEFETLRQRALALRESNTVKGADGVINVQSTFQFDPLRVPPPDRFERVGLAYGELQMNRARARLMFLRRRLRLTNDRRVSVDGRRVSMADSSDSDLDFAARL